VDSSRPLRADAARNADRILRAARETYASSGPDASLDDIARRAGVGSRTLYRRFPTKGELVRALLDKSIAEDIAPAIEQALADENPMNGLKTVMAAAMSLAARDYNILLAARSTGALNAQVYTPFYESLALLTRRAQDAGLVRRDLAADDLPRIMLMLISVLWTMDPRSDGWRRYLALMLDSLSPTPQRNPLPSNVAPLQVPPPGGWPTPQEDGFGHTSPASH
jgi:AcrR family transcriptional regulator